MDNKVQIIKIEDELYQKKLRDIFDPPKQLYVKGYSEILNNFSIAIVGCRNCSKYGENISKSLSYNLSKKNIVIISGLAKGIDSFAHIGSLQAKGKTIAILGSGLNNIYPKENEKLAREIIKNGGAVISEYELSEKPIPENFPRRNRIISGLSNGVIIVEAKQKSGAIITVDFALEQGKNVYSVPGNINSINSSGTNELIKQGAKMVTNVNDILEDYQ